jgi:hypothetical protein
LAKVVGEWSRRRAPRQDVSRSGPLKAADAEILKTDAE